MIDKKLKKEKDEILQFLFNKIDSLNSDESINNIYDKVKKLNELLDIYDTKTENFIDSLTSLIKKGKSEIKHVLRDIFDNYDKKNKEGELIYSENDRIKIQNLIKEINDECDKNFWDRFKDILRRS